MSPSVLRVPSFERLAVLVAGDAMLDTYWHGDATRISPEAPVPVVRVEHEEHRPGGAANVAVNLRALGARPILLGAVGADAEGARLRRGLEETGVEHDLVEVAGLRTVTKLRVLSRHQQLIRLDREAREPPELPARAISDRFERHLDAVRAVILSDYGKGVLAGVRELIAPARARGLPVLVDPKGSDFEPYRGASVLTPNLAEIQAVVGVCRDLDTLTGRAERLREHLELEAVLITRGEHGMTLVRAGAAPRHEPARAREVYDVTGAGDTVIATLAASLAAGATAPEAMALANAAAGVVVGKLGAAAVGPDELRAALEGPPPGRRSGIVGPGEVAAVVAEARRAGERIVMTNGCFDLLHAGHVRYLREARALGDRLVVAVNDDDSVRRLKGPGRPLVPLAERMEVLCALETVDWVVPFGEDTPAALVAAVAPDVLVKGGDYRPDEIAGARAVRERGGRVEVLAYHEGCSTSALIASARGGARG